MNNQGQNQRLYWSISRPLKYMGLTLDEWGVTLTGVIPGMILLNVGHDKLGLVLMLVGVFLCYVFKKFKKVSEHFRVVSYLVAKGIWATPQFYPSLKEKKIGK